MWSSKIHQQYRVVASDGIGPLWHGTTAQHAKAIQRHGFSVRPGPKTHGYIDDPHTFGFIPPFDLAGFAVYFARTKRAALRWGPVVLGPFRVDDARTLKVHFRSTEELGRWWLDHGYDPELAARDRVAATEQLTKTLAASWDVIVVTTASRKLDPPQVAVLNPSKLKGAIRVDK